MIEIRCENVEELKQVLSLLGRVSETKEAPSPAPAPAPTPVPAPANEPLPWKEEPAAGPDPNPVPFELAQPEKAADPAPAEAKEAPKHTLTEVRAILADLQKRKGKEALKALLDSFGAKAVSKVPDDKLDELYEKAVELNA